MTRALLAALAVLALGAAPAAASPATASFTAVQTAPLVVTVDSSASTCPWGFCSSSWRYYGPGTSRLGATMGYGSPLTFRFPAAGVYTVVLSFSVRCSPRGVSSCPAVASQTVVVG